MLVTLALKTLLSISQNGISPITLSKLLGKHKSCLGRVFNFKFGHFVMHASARLIQKYALA